MFLLSFTKYKLISPNLQVYPGDLRHVEIRFPVSGLERCPGCHPERSEGSLRPSSQTLRCAQGDRPSLQMSTSCTFNLTALSRMHALYTHLIPKKLHTINWSEQACRGKSLSSYFYCGE